eukprot:CAMPEP_0172708254 /NCGR_PEP_ID=MMETSP1074-20121228/50449_1 /TAXON_ID=2916 /ORGANISM="Ceratium fusus, Strain PA161109" /LENGTH=35 /DNA_ID= /DNA_START= /DNA_END= /DNA_ORIENTATION=
MIFQKVAFPLALLLVWTSAEVQSTAEVEEVQTDEP